MLLAGVVVALVVGFAAGFLVSGQTGGNVLAPQGQAGAAGLSVADRNFIVNVANSQVQLTAATLAGTIDWCQANGGQWNIVQQRGTVDVNQEAASQLQQQGVEVSKDANGNYIASVAILSRDTCIFPVQKAQ